MHFILGMVTVGILLKVAIMGITFLILRIFGDLILDIASSLILSHLPAGGLSLTLAGVSGWMWTCFEMEYCINILLSAFISRFVYSLVPLGRSQMSLPGF